MKQFNKQIYGKFRKPLQLNKELHKRFHTLLKINDLDRKYFK